MRSIIFYFKMELKDFAKELKAYRQNNTLPQGDVKNALADIYEREWPTHKRWGASTINRSCPSCISDMMKSLCAHWESMQVEFKGVPQSIEVSNELKDLDAMIDDLGKNDLSHVLSMRWGEFKTYCKEQGLSVKGKTKDQLLEELGL